MTAKNNVKELCFDKDKILSVWCILHFTFTHLADAFIQSDLQCIQVIHFFCHFIILLTTPSGSTRSRCLGWLPCCPVRTYWPGVVPDSRTRKSPSLVRSLSACLRLRGPWNQGSFCSCSAIGAATAPDTTKAASNGSKR